MPNDLRADNWDVLIVGESLADEVVSEGVTTSHPGGSPYNVAVGLGRLHVKALLHTAIGHDERGTLLRTHAESSGVSITKESLTADPTSFARATIDGAGSAVYDFTVTWRPTPFSLTRAPRALHIGSISAALPPGCDLIAGVVSALRATSIISLDPNIRPQLTKDRGKTRWRLEELVRLADVVKVSDEDLQWLYPERSLNEIAADWLARGPDVVVITRGGDGAVAFSRWGTHTATPAETAVVDTIGAGDSFTAGLLAALLAESVSVEHGRLARLRSDQIERAIDFATRCAAITVGRAGAQPPWADELALTSP